MNTTRHVKTLSLSFAAVLGSLALAAGAQAAATIEVNSTTDESNTVNGICSVREALQSSIANNNVGGCSSSGAYGQDDVIEVPAGTYRLTIPAPGDVAAGDFELVDQRLTVRGTGPGQSVIEQTTGDGVFEPSGNSVLTLENLVIRGGRASSGGLIHHTGIGVTVRNSTLTDGQAVTSNGGALQAILGINDFVRIENSTISGNSAVDSGGGLHINGGDVTIANSTITNNTADTDGDPDVQTGGGYVIGGDTFEIANSIVAGNSAPGNAPDCSGFPDVFGGVNVYGTANCDQGPNDIVADPRLGGLADNGGPTPTHALLADSPAINKGIGCLPTDQRLVDRGLGGACDVGAYELVTCNGLAATRIGTQGDDTLTGTDGPDVFLAGGGNDRVEGGAGDDVLCGGAGNDNLDGGDGNDKLLGEDGDDTMDGRGGDDELTGGAGNDTALGGDGDGADRIDLGDGDDSASGGGGNDTLDLGDGVDSADGGDGNDKVDGGEANDVLLGGAGNDSLLGQAGKDKLNGQAGNDKVNGGSGKDKVKGGAGKDKLIGAGGKDTCSGGGGKDRGAGCERESGI